MRVHVSQHLQSSWVVSPHVIRPSVGYLMRPVKVRAPLPGTLERTAFVSVVLLVGEFFVALATDFSLDKLQLDLVRDEPVLASPAEKFANGVSASGTIVDCKIVHVHPDKSICSFLI
jgi:hypothetical protein